MRISCCHILLLAITGLHCCVTAEAQGPGAPVLWQHFGIGDKNNVLAASALPAGSTGFSPNNSGGIYMDPGIYGGEWPESFLKGTTTLIR